MLVFSENTSTYQGIIQNYAIRTNTEGYGEGDNKGAAIYVTNPNVQVGAGIATGYAYPVRGGLGANDNAQPVGMTLQTNMRSSSNETTTPKNIINLDMYESAQNLGIGEGLKIAWRQRRQDDGLDATPLDVGYLAFQKQNATDNSDEYDFVVGAGIGTETFRVRSDGSATFTGALPPAINNAAGNTSAVFATSYVNFSGRGGGVGSNKTIRDSLNISGVTDLAQGRYRVDFATNYPNANYVVVATCADTDSDNDSTNVEVRFLSNDHFDLYLEDVDDGYNDRDHVMAVVFISPS